MSSTQSGRTPIVVGVALLLGAGLVGLVTGVSLPAALALAAAVAIGAVIFARPEIGLLLTVATIPLEAALMFGGSITATRLVGVVTVAAWGFQKLLRRESWRPVLTSNYFIAGLLFFAFATTSLLWADNTRATQVALVPLAQTFVLGLLVADLGRNWDTLRRVAQVTVLAACVAATLTVAQYAQGAVNRAGSGIAGGINNTALVLVTMLPLSFALLRDPGSRAWRLAGLAGIALTVAAIPVTLSRMSLILLPIVFLAQLRSGSSFLRGGLLGAVALVLIFTFAPPERLGDRLQSIRPYLASTVGASDGIMALSDRGYHLRVGAAIFSENPVVGVGYANFGYEFLTSQWEVTGAGSRFWNSPRSPHSSHVGLLAELGGAGFLLWAGLLGVTLRNLVVAWRRVGRVGVAQLAIAQAVTLAFCVQIVYGFYEDIHLEKLLWVLFGLGVALASLAEQPPRKERVPVRDRAVRRIWSTGRVRWGRRSRPRIAPLTYPF